VPPTEKGSRRHTSTVTVAVLKEDVCDDIELTKKDVETSVCRSDGPGGQNVNKVSTAVRMEHKETGETVFVHDGRSQDQNRKKAFKRLEKKLNKQKKKNRHQEVNAERKEQIGCGKKGDKIRTYNYREDRVKNHKNGKIVWDVRKIVEQGRIDLIQ